MNEEHLSDINAMRIFQATIMMAVHRFRNKNMSADQIAELAIADVDTLNVKLSNPKSVKKIKHNQTNEQKQKRR